jgi:hypothetical protein
MDSQRLEIGAPRRCDNDGRLYTVKREHHRFCCNKCRSEFHRYGSPLLQLRPHIQAEVQQAMEQVELRIFAALHPRAQLRYRQQNPTRAGRLAAILERAS